MDLKLFFLQLILVVEFCQTLPNTYVREYIDDETAEIAVPRSPRIHGALIEYIEFPFGYQLHNLTCEIAEGIPTPKVIWIKDHLGVQPPLREEFDAEKKTSTLLFPQKNQASTASTPAPDNQDANSSSIALPNHQHYPDSSLSNIPGVKVHAVYANPESTPPANKTYSNWNGTWEGNYTCVAANFLGRATKTYIISFSKEIPTVIPDTTPPSLDVEETTLDDMAIGTTVLYLDDGEEMTTILPDISDKTTVFPYRNGNIKARVAYLTKLNITGRYTLLATRNGTIKNLDKLPSAPSPPNSVTGAPPKYANVKLPPMNLSTETVPPKYNTSDDSINVPLKGEENHAVPDAGKIPKVAQKYLAVENVTAAAATTVEPSKYDAVVLKEKLPPKYPLVTATEQTVKGPTSSDSTTATKSTSPKYPGTTVERVMANYRVPNIAANVTENHSNKSPPSRTEKPVLGYPVPELATSMKDAVPPKYSVGESDREKVVLEVPPSPKKTVYQLSVQPMIETPITTDQRPKVYNLSIPLNITKSSNPPYSLPESLPVVSNSTTKTIDTEDYTLPTVVIKNSTTTSAVNPGNETTRATRSHRRSK